MDEPEFLIYAGPVEDNTTGAPYSGEMQLWTATTMGDWEVRHRFVAQDGNPVVAEIQIFCPKERERVLFNTNLSEEQRANLPTTSTRLPKGGITRRMLAKIPAPTVTARVREVLRENDPDELKALGLGNMTANEVPRRGRRTDLLRYALIARAYVQAVESNAHNPVEIARQEINKTTAYPSSRKTVAEAISRCRRPPLELLTKSLPGRAGGQLTDKALQILRANEEAD